MRDKCLNLIGWIWIFLYECYVIVNIGQMMLSTSILEALQRCIVIFKYCNQLFGHFLFFDRMRPIIHIDSNHRHETNHSQNIMFVWKTNRWHSICYKAQISRLMVKLFVMKSYIILSIKLTNKVHIYICLKTFEL